MSKRGDNIHKRKDGRWEGRYSIGRKDSGSIKYASVYGKTYGEAKEKLNRAILNKTLTTVSAEKHTTFSEVLSLWLNNNRIRLKGGTVTKYQNVINAQILPELGDIYIENLDSTTVNMFLNNKLTSGNISTSKPLSPSYVRTMAIIINAALTFAVKEGLRAPVTYPVFKPTLDKKDVKIISSKDQKALESYLLTDFNLYKAAIIITLYTGLRLGEICALSWDDIDLCSRVIHVRHTVTRVNSFQKDQDCSTLLTIDLPKTKNSLRDIPISSKLFPLILETKSLSASQYVISSTTGFVNPRNLEYKFTQALVSANVERVNFHCLRHTFATRCIEAGVDIKTLSEILGHSNVSITLNTYVHSSMEMKKNQIEKLCTFLS